MNICVVPVDCSSYEKVAITWVKVLIHFSSKNRNNRKKLNENIKLG